MVGGGGDGHDFQSELREWKCQNAKLGHSRILSPTRLRRREPEWRADRGKGTRSPHLGVLGHRASQWRVLNGLRVLGAGEARVASSVYPASCTNVIILKMCYQGLPWWRSRWESACQCGGHGFEPWSGKIPRVAEQLGPWATTTEPARLEPVLRNKRGRDSERPAHRDEEWPPLAATRESSRTETKTKHSQK